VVPHIPASNPAPSPPTLRSQFRPAPDSRAGRAATATTTTGESKNRMRWPLFLQTIGARGAMSSFCITKPIPTALNFFTAIQSNCRDPSRGTWFRTNANCGLHSWSPGMWSFTRPWSAIKALFSVIYLLCNFNGWSPWYEIWWRPVRFSEFKLAITII